MILMRHQERCRARLAARRSARPDQCRKDTSPAREPSSSGSPAHMARVDLKPEDQGARPRRRNQRSRAGADAFPCSSPFGADGPEGESEEERGSCFACEACARRREKRATRAGKIRQHSSRH